MACHDLFFWLFCCRYFFLCFETPFASCFLDIYDYTVFTFDPVEGTESRYVLFFCFLKKIKKNLLFRSCSLFLLGLGWFWWKWDNLKKTSLTFLLSFFCLVPQNKTFPNKTATLHNATDIFLVFFKRSDSSNWRNQQRISFFFFFPWSKIWEKDYPNFCFSLGKKYNFARGNKLVCPLSVFKCLCFFFFIFRKAFDQFAQEFPELLRQVLFCLFFHSSSGLFYVCSIESSK